MPPKQLGKTGSNGLKINKYDTSSNTANVDALNAFNEVVTACYGKTLAPNYK